MIDTVLNINGKSVEIDSDFTCSVSGHRRIAKMLDYQKLKGIFTKLIDSNVNTFLVGMAVGFDSFCFKVLEEIRKEKKVRIIACIPCRSQDYKYNELQKLEYKRMLSSADEKILLSENYTPYCMQKRNMFMIDHSKFLISFLTKEKGGTFNTVSYAKTKDISILEVSNMITKEI